MSSVQRLLAGWLRGGAATTMLEGQAGARGASQTALGARSAGVHKKSSHGTVYAVRTGRETGIFESWNECQLRVRGPQRAAASVAAGRRGARGSGAPECARAVSHCHCMYACGVQLFERVASTRDHRRTRARCRADEGRVERAV